MRWWMLAWRLRAKKGRGEARRDRLDLVVRSGRISDGVMPYKVNPGKRA